MILAWRWQWTPSGQSYVPQPCLNPLATLTTPQTTISRSRLTFIHNPTVLGAPAQSALSRFVAHLIYKGLLSEATPASLLRALGAEDVVDDSPSRDAVIRKLAGDVEPAEYEALVYDDYVKSTRRVARELGVQPGQSALVVNGRVSCICPLLDLCIADASLLR